MAPWNDECAKVDEVSFMGSQFEAATWTCPLAEMAFETGGLAVALFCFGDAESIVLQLFCLVLNQPARPLATSHDEMSSSLASHNRRK